MHTNSIHSDYKSLLEGWGDSLLICQKYTLDYPPMSAETQAADDVALEISVEAGCHHFRHDWPCERYVAKAVPGSTTDWNFSFVNHSPLYV